MPKTCNAFNWTMYVILASFIAWGVWFESIQMNLFNTTPVSNMTHPVKKASDATPEKKTVVFPMKPTEQKSADEAQSCMLTRYNGNATVQGWYEEEEVYGKKALVLKVADEDRVKLPEKIQQWADGTPVESILLSNVNAETKKLLIKASAEKPTTVDLVEVKVYCEGLPVATLAQK